MANNFCPNCGAKLKEGARFCSSCGSSIGVNVQQPMMNPGPVPMPSQGNGKNKNTLMIVGAVIAVALLAIVGYKALGSTDTVNKEPVATVATTDTDTKPAKQEQAAVPTDKRDIDKADLHKYGFDGEIVATSYGHDSKGYLAVEKTDQYGYRNIVVDKVNDRVAVFKTRMTFVKFAQELQGKPDTMASLLIDFTVRNDTRDKDEKNGAWHGENHVLPVYALYKKSATGEIVPDKIFSGGGERPSHYHGYLYEQKNVDMTNLVLTEAMALLANANEHNISV